MRILLRQDMMPISIKRTEMIEAMITSTRGLASRGKNKIVTTLINAAKC